MPFAGLRVVDLSPNRVGAQTSQIFADFGADVIQVEPPDGATIRAAAAYPFWARGKRSIVLDLHGPADRDTLRELVRRADVLIETFPPGVLDDLGLGDAELRALNPGLIHTSVTGFGRHGPFADAPGYEGLVMAKLGVNHLFRRMSPYPEPPFLTVPWATFAASQVAIHGTLAALIERERSGLGQWVETNLAQAFTSLDTWGWFEHLVADRWPEAYVTNEAYDDAGRPRSPITFMLLIALTKDGRWLQFAAVAPRLFAAKMKALGLDWMFTDEAWKGLPTFGDDADQRGELWARMLRAAGERTLAEWQQVFDDDPDVFAEPFRNGAEALEHPQLIHDGFTVDVVDAERGPVRQPAAIVKAARTPADVSRSAPRLDEHRADVLTLAAQPPQPRPPAGDGPRELPLAGVTVLEIATLFAAPHGATMLTDLGARVIKIEPLEGDRIRSILPFPESGGAKAMQGKESLAVDLGTEEGRAIVRELASRADVVVQGYRAGAMGRLGLDYASVAATNPDVIYVNAPGYGVDGPYGHRPAYAPSIGAATGLPLANVGDTVPERAGLSMDEIMDGSRRLSAASALANAQADGFAALGVATAILFGVAARQRGAGGQELFSSMLNTGAHAMSAQVVTYPGAPAAPAADHHLRGFGPLYRIYAAAQGFVFLGAPSEHDWLRLCAALADCADLAEDPRYATPARRDANADALAADLAAIFSSRSAALWEADLLPLGVACAEVRQDSIERLLTSDEFGGASGYLATVEHPMFDEHLRLAPYVRFSRSRTRALPGVLNGQHTDALLAELGRTADEIADLRARAVVG